MLFFKRSNRWGMILLAIWIIVFNLPLLSSRIQIPLSETILPILGIVAGILILLQR